MQIHDIPIGKLIAYDKNAKIHSDKQNREIANSLLRFGWKQPLVVDRNNVLIVGHGRLEGAKIASLTDSRFLTAPCIIADDLTDEEIKAYRLADNKLNESPWDFDLLDKELQDITGIDMSDFGFDMSAFEEEPAEVVEDDYNEERPEEPKSKLGDIYQLGRHRLMCGDSTDIEDIKALMRSETADLILTDPPYNVDYKGGTKDALKIMNDSMEDSSFRAFLTDAFSNVNKVLKPGAAFYIWHADSEGLNFRCAARNAGWKIRQCLVWVKNSLVLGRQDYQWKHEPCLYGWKEGSHYFTEDRTQSTVYDDKIDLKKLKKNEMLELLEKIFSNSTPTTVLYEDKPLVNDVHPTMKPIRLMAQLIKNSTKPKQIVLDVFGGSGSTLIACEQLDRSCYMMELDPKYVDVIIDRWEKFTGQKAIKLN